MNQMKNSEKEIKSIDDLVLIHLTDYPPKGGIIRTAKSAGATMPEEYNGVKFKRKRERDTIHFVLNGEVTSHSEGNWSETKYAIIIPLKNMQKEKIYGGITADIYTEGDVEIPEDSYVLCSKEEQERLQQEVGDKIEVKGVDNNYINGYANEFIQELGYKREKIGKWSWENEKDNEIAIQILLENGWKLGAHSYSEHRRDEVVLEDINRTIEIIKIMRKEELSNSSKEYILYKHERKGLFNDAQYIKTFSEKMDEIGIPIPDSVIDEIQSIRQGDLSDKVKEEEREIIEEDPHGLETGTTDYYDTLADFILSRRTIGEIRLSQIRDNIKQNDQLSFEDLLEMFDDTLYKFTTEERRIEFLKTQGIEFSDIEMKVLGNQELRNIYLEILDIKDIPYGELSEKDRIKFSEFQDFYNNSFENLRVSDEQQYDNDGNFISANGTIRKRDGKFTKEEIERLRQEGKCIDSVLDVKVVLSNITYDNDTSLSQYVQNCEQMVQETDEILSQRTVSTEELGKQSLAEQTDTKGKNNMEQILAQKMKEYTIHLGKKQEIEGVTK